ncbi:MAG TPA: crotonyl-CoA carboxylase/reductase, partial [Polyangia bacterium]
MSTTLPLHTVPKTLGETPETMQAIVIRKEREGDPMQSMKVEEVPVPELGPNDVLVLVMAAGVNFNGV